jgi:hypothetical protein
MSSRVKSDRLLVIFLGDVAKAFPNEFPRNVDRATVREISRRLGEARGITEPVEPEQPPSEAA